MASGIKQKVGPAEALRLGSDVAKRKRRMSAKDWKKLVAHAHARGRTVRSELFEGNMPDALRERTKTSLRDEAEKNIADAYKPVDEMLDSQTTRAQALSQKRAQDNIAYRTWMDQQATRQATQAAAAQQRYETYLQQQQAQAAQSGQLQQQAQQASQSAPNTVSDMSQSNAVKSLAADEAKSQGYVANARAESAALIPTLQMQQQNLGLATRGFYESAESKRKGDENNDLKDIFTAREKSKAERAADKMREVARLMDNETAKAQSNRDYAAAAEKLDIEGFKAQSDADLKDKELDLKTKKFDLDTWIAKNKVSVDRAKIKLGYDKIKQQDGKSAADRALKKYLGDQKHRDSVADRKDRADARGQGDSSKADQTVSTIYGALVGLHKSHPKGTVSPAGRPIGFREYLRSKGYSDLQIDVAEDARKHGGKLSAAGRAKAKRLGIKNPEAITWG